MVDAETGRPLGGVVVAASWHYIDIRTGEFAGVLFMTDAVTDEHREFVLPSWGPLGITMGNSPRTARAGLCRALFQALGGGWWNHGDVAWVQAEKSRAIIIESMRNATPFGIDGRCLYLADPASQNSRKQLGRDTGRAK